MSKALAKSSLMTKVGARHLLLHWMISSAWMNVSEMQRPWRKPV
jgi:hypothetical protein